MVKTAAVYLTFAIIVAAVFVVAAYNKGGKDITGIMHNPKVIASENENAVPLSFSWISVFIILIVATLISHVISAKKEGTEKRQHVLRKRES